MKKVNILLNLFFPLILHFNVAGAIHVKENVPSENQIAPGSTQIGGQWKPKTCKALYKLAIIVPYRDRPKERSILLYHMHPFLQRQLVDYRIFIVEQVLLHCSFGLHQNNKFLFKLEIFVFGQVYNM